ncbi:Rac GTPase [Pelomyxa schiedti]|nr:Rac GTPase [Pelomyxa schiedti]
MSDGDGETIKVVVVGDTGVGKTSMLISYTTNSFSECVTTAFQNYCTNISIAGTRADVALWDTAAEADFDRLRPLAYPMTDVFLLCFSLVSPASLDAVVTKWAPEVKRHCPEASLILVGTKSDVAGSSACQMSDINNNPQTVAESIGAKAYITCSAKTQTGLTDVITTAARVALKHID